MSSQAERGRLPRMQWRMHVSTDIPETCLRGQIDAQTFFDQKADIVLPFTVEPDVRQQISVSSNLHPAAGHLAVLLETAQISQCSALFIAGVARAYHEFRFKM